MKALLDREWQKLVEMDDRTSPEEHPDMALITRDELGEVIRSALIGIPGAEKGTAVGIFWRTRYHDDRGEEWMSWSGWAQKNGHSGYEDRPGYDYEERPLYAAPTSERVQALSETDGWRLITDNPPLDREFLGANVGLLRRDGSPRPDGIWHIRGRHIDYAGGPDRWTWNEANSGVYGIILTHWREMPALPHSTINPPKPLATAPKSNRLLSNCSRSLEV